MKQIIWNTIVAVTLFAAVAFAGGPVVTGGGMTSNQVVSISGSVMATNVVKLTTGSDNNGSSLTNVGYIGRATLAADAPTWTNSFAGLAASHRRIVGRGFVKCDHLAPAMGGFAFRINGDAGASSYVWLMREYWRKADSNPGSYALHSTNSMVGNVKVSGTNGWMTSLVEVSIDSPVANGMERHGRIMTWGGYLGSDGESGRFTSFDFVWTNKVDTITSVSFVANYQCTNMVSGSFMDWSVE